MEGLVEGIYKICDALTPITLAVLVLSLAITGLITIFGGEEARGRFKETIKWIIIGSAVAFGATGIGKEISSWFM